ncbi:hypothetical protein, partial [Mesorhizobium sp. M7A.F.Ca.CA.002.05.1.1]|uniref:hypothetical protein n=1 Tax=Mesorhizobium sp. M7A.F.Ca.CA.002.05.1.1 TaxID=2496704 RepID=UPI0019D0AF0B
MRQIVGAAQQEDVVDRLVAADQTILRRIVPEDRQFIDTVDRTPAVENVDDVIALEVGARGALPRIVGAKRVDLIE